MLSSCTTCSYASATVGPPLHACRASSNPGVVPKPKGTFRKPSSSSSCVLGSPLTYPVTVTFAPFRSAVLPLLSLPGPPRNGIVYTGTLHCRGHWAALPTPVNTCAYKGESERERDGSPESSSFPLFSRHRFAPIVRCSELKAPPNASFATW